MAALLQGDNSFLLLFLKNSLSLQIFLLCFLSLLIWRRWKFTIAPNWYPNRPETFPYWIPFIGHSFQFFADGDGTVTRARMHFGNNRAPFKLVIMGETVYVITSPQDTALVHKQVDNLSMDRWVKDLMEQFGASTPSINAMWNPVPDSPAIKTPTEFQRTMQNSSEEPLVHVCQLLFRLQLNPGKLLDEIQSCLLGTVHDRMTWDNIPESLTFSSTANTRSISLLQWSQHVLLEGATTSFFGKALLQVEPDLFEHFCEFDDSSWKLSYRIPPLWAKDVLRSKAFAQDAMKRYFDLPAAMRADASWLVHSIEARMRACGIGSKDIGTLVLMFYWVINANAWKASFWMLVHIINNPLLLRDILQEVNPLLATRPHLSSVDLSTRLADCPSLVAVYHEALRLTASSVSVRTVVGPANLGNLVLDKGARVVIPYRQMLLDEQVFGVDAARFNHDRFLQNPKLAKSPSFKPFGGGATLCPGRDLAQREVLSFVALAVGKFGVEMGKPFNDSHRNIPDMETKIPCIGIMGPVAGQDVHVTVKRPE